MELTQGTNREAQLLGLMERSGSGLGREQGKSRLGQGTADTGLAVGDSVGSGRGYWWDTARDRAQALLTETRLGGWGVME